MIDVTQPLEAVHRKTGRTVPMTYLGPMPKWGGGVKLDGSFNTTEAPSDSESNSSWYGDGRNYCAKDLWFIRNISTNELDELRAFKERALARFPALSEPETDEQFVERMADEYAGAYESPLVEAFTAALAWARANPR